MVRGFLLSRYDFYIPVARFDFLRMKKYYVKRMITKLLSKPMYIAEYAEKSITNFRDRLPSPRRISIIITIIIYSNDFFFLEYPILSCALLCYECRRHDEWSRVRASWKYVIYVLRALRYYWAIERIKNNTKPSSGIYFKTKSNQVSSISYELYLNYLLNY